MNPLPREEACAILDQARVANGSATATKATRSARALFARAGHHDCVERLMDRVDHDSVLFDATASCRCCRAYQLASDNSSGWRLGHKDMGGTLITFDVDAQITTVRSSLRIAKQSGKATTEELDVLFDALAQQVDPRNWSVNAKESFKHSEAFDLQAKERGGWRGLLLEKFETSWNPDATTDIENILRIDYTVGHHSLNLQYSLNESLSSKVWLSRQAGGMDIDRGSCTVESIPQLDGDNSVFISASKTVRFTEPEGGPMWLGTLMNYLAPVMLGVWLSRVVQGGAFAAIEALGKAGPQGQTGYGSSGQGSAEEIRA